MKSKCESELCHLFIAATVPYLPERLWSYQVRRYDYGSLRNHLSLRCISDLIKEEWYSPRLPESRKSIHSDIRPWKDYWSCRLQSINPRAIRVELNHWTQDKLQKMERVHTQAFPSSVLIEPNKPPRRESRTLGICVRDNIYSRAKNASNHWANDYGEAASTRYLRDEANYWGYLITAVKTTNQTGPLSTSGCFEICVVHR